MRNLARYASLLLIIPTLLLAQPGCDSPFGRNADHSREPWYQHGVTTWRMTPDGHLRDAGPFGSVAAGWTTDAELDAATDAGYARYALLFPEYPVADHPFSINDDYVMWATGSKSGYPGCWAAGVEFSFGAIGVTLWTRGSTAASEPAGWVVRPPGTDQWGGAHPDWRYTTWPLLPALEHELLHAAIGDPDHTSALWGRLSLDPRAAAH